MSQKKFTLGIDLGTSNCALSVCDLATDDHHLERLLSLFEDWARALDAGHRAGVIHGALAPEDLIVGTGGKPNAIRRPGLGPAASGVSSCTSVNTGAPTSRFTFSRMRSPSSSPGPR